LQCAVASCDVRVRTHFFETCDVRACGAFLGLRCAITTSHIFFRNSARCIEKNRIRHYFATTLRRSTNLIHNTIQKIGSDPNLDEVIQLLDARHGLHEAYINMEDELDDFINYDTFFHQQSRLLHTANLISSGKPWMKHFPCRQNTGITLETSTTSFKSP
jgi:hypothetical protein